MTQRLVYDVVIIGGGAAGLTAGLYTCRAGLKTILLERLMPGGQVVNTETVENFPGFPDGVSGPEFGPLLMDQTSKHGLEIELSEVSDVRQDGNTWQIKGYDAEWYARSVIFAGGSTLKKLGVPGEDELHGAGVSYCGTCDGGFFTNQEIGIVGSGDSALDEAITLTAFASKVTVLSRDASFLGQKVLQDRVLEHPKIDVRWNTAVNSVIGESRVQGISVTDVVSGENSQIDLEGLFIYVGLEPNTGYLSNLLPLDNGGHIPTDLCMRTPIPGLLAAGDIRQHSAAQLVSAAGDGATAAIASWRYIEGEPWPA